MTKPPSGFAGLVSLPMIGSTMNSSLSNGELPVMRNSYSAKCSERYAEKRSWASMYSAVCVDGGTMTN